MAPVATESLISTPLGARSYTGASGSSNLAQVGASLEEQMQDVLNLACDRAKLVSRLEEAGCRCKLLCTLCEFHLLLVLATVLAALVLPSWRDQDFFGDQRMNEEVCAKLDSSLLANEAPAILSQHILRTCHCCWMLETIANCVRRSISLASAPRVLRGEHPSASQFVHPLC